MGSAFFFFLAGFDTTATAIVFLAYNLACFPEAQEKLHQEIIDVLGEKVCKKDMILEIHLPS